MLPAPVNPSPTDLASGILPQLQQLADSGLYQGQREERLAQAARDFVLQRVEHHDLTEVQIGATLNLIQDNQLYAPLGYPTMRAFLQSESISRLGKSQLQKYMTLARACIMDAPAMTAPALPNPASPLPTLSSAFVARAGTEKSYMVAATWRNRTPAERQELLDQIEAPIEDFMATAYQRERTASFSVDGQTVLLWLDGHGIPVAQITTKNPQERDLLLDRLRARPQGRT